MSAELALCSIGCDTYCTCITLRVQLPVTVNLFTFTCHVCHDFCIDKQNQIMVTNIDNTHYC